MPVCYRPMIIDEWQHLCQGDGTVADYIAQFDKLMIRCNIDEELEATLARFRAGHRLEYQRELILQEITTLEKANRFATNMELYTSHAQGTNPVWSSTPKQYAPSPSSPRLFLLLLSLLSTTQPPSSHPCHILLYDYSSHPPLHPPLHTPHQRPVVMGFAVETRRISTQTNLRRQPSSLLNELLKDEIREGYDHGHLLRSHRIRTRELPTSGAKDGATSRPNVRLSGKPLVLREPSSSRSTTTTSTPPPPDVTEPVTEVYEADPDLAAGFEGHPGFMGCIIKETSPLTPLERTIALARPQNTSSREPLPATPQAQGFDDPIRTSIFSTFTKIADSVVKILVDSGSVVNAVAAASIAAQASTRNSPCSLQGHVD